MPTWNSAIIASDIAFLLFAVSIGIDDMSGCWGWNFASLVALVGDSVMRHRTDCSALAPSTTLRLFCFNDDVLRSDSGRLGVSEGSGFEFPNCG